MRILHIILAALMLLFIAVQYNDPDGAIWMVIYAVPALWAILAAIKKGWVSQMPGRALLWICLVLAVAGTVYFWPRSERWWSMDVWYNVETAREGMGMMIVAVVLAIILATTRAARDKLAARPTRQQRRDSLR